MRREVIIQAVIDRIHARTYLEIGVQRGKNFLAIKAKNKIAVDPKFIIGYLRRLKNIKQFLRHSFIEKESDLFFEEDAKRLLKTGIDVAFIDGLHTYEQSLRDFDNCLKYLNSGGVIILHDCNPLWEGAGVKANSPEDARKIHSNKIMEWNGDVWKTIVYIRSQYKDLNVFVLDCDHGVGIVYRGVPESLLPFAHGEVANLTYEYFDSRRKELLNLKKPDYLQEFLTNLSN